MKESSCHNPKMAAYCQEVRKLEDMFDGLDLNHIPQWLNEMADELAKMASDQELVPVSIFTSDQHEPLVRYEEPGLVGDKPSASDLGAGPPSAPSEPFAPGSGLAPIIPIRPQGHGDRQTSSVGVR
jgi:hypothetical protein